MLNLLNVNPGARFPNMYNQNGGFFPHNSQLSPPVFQQNSIRPPAPFQTDAQLNSQHVFGSNPRFPTPSQPPPQFLPNLNFIRSTPPPAIISPRPEPNLPDWKNSAPLRDTSYLSSQLSTPRASTDYSAPHQLNGTFNQPRNGFVNNMEQFPSQNPQPNAFHQPLTSFPTPSTFQPQSHTEIRPGSFDQQSPIRPPAFQQQSHTNNRPGSFDHQSMRPSDFQQQSYTNNRPGSFDQQSMRPSAFQPQSHTNNRPGSFDKQSPIGPSAFQQQSRTNDRHGAFQQQSSNSNNFHYKNRNMGNNPFGSQPFNSNDKNPMQYKNYNNRNNNRQNNWNGSSRGFHNLKDIKKEKEGKISSLPFSCDPCDRSFGTENDWKAHLAEHIKCNSGGCQFEAHPKIVFLHKKMQHVAGYAEKINKLSSNEEIEKWRAERRRRFPTQENIARRQAEQAEKEARGEVMETPESTGKMKRKGDHQGKSNNYKRRRNRGRNQHYSLNFKPKTEEDAASEPESSDDEPVTKLARFAGVNAAISSETDEDSADTSGKGEEAVSKEKTSSPSELESGKDQAKEIAVAENTLDAEEGCTNEIITINSSSNDSGSEKDSAKKTPADENTSKEKENKLIKERRRLESSNLVVYDISDDDDEAPIELPSKGPDGQNLSSSQGIVEVSDDQPSSEKPVNDTQSAKKNNGTGPKKDFPRRKREFVPRKKEEPNRCSMSILKAFYADEIKRERNKMFQCVRYIVQKNFFGIGQ